MRLFVSRGMHLAALAPAAKAVYTIFLIFVSLGMVSSWQLYAERLGTSLRAPPGEPSVAGRYLDEPAAAAGADGGGPTLDLGLGDEGAAPAEDLKGPWILDVFHQHLFSVSVVYLILAHLFMLTRLAQPVAVATVLLAGLSALAHVIAPVWIHAQGSALWLMPVTGALMMLSWGAMILWSLLAMWCGVGLGGDSGRASTS